MDRRERVRKLVMLLVEPWSLGATPGPQLCHTVTDDGCSAAGSDVRLACQRWNINDAARDLLASP